MISHVISCKKIDHIRASNAVVSAPDIDERVVYVPLTDLSLVTSDEVAKILRKSPAKQCQLDPQRQPGLSRVLAMCWLLLSLQSVMRRLTNRHFQTVAR